MRLDWLKTIGAARHCRTFILLFAVLGTSLCYPEFYIRPSVHRSEARAIHERFPSDQYVIVSLGTSQPSVEIFLESLGRTDLVRIPIVVLKRSMMRFHSAPMEFEAVSADQSGELMNRFVQYVEHVAGPLRGRKIVIMRRLVAGLSMQTFGKVLIEAKKRLPHDHPVQFMEAAFFAEPNHALDHVQGFASTYVDTQGRLYAYRDENLEDDRLRRLPNMSRQPMFAKDFFTKLLEPTPNFEALNQGFRLTPIQSAKFRIERAALFCASAFR